jgi:formamidopyrimidine-DNA glycosylase
MPESPEVQELASFLTAHTTGRVVRTVDVLLPKALKTRHPSPADLVGRRITGVSRLGKMIDIATVTDSDDLLHVIVHFGHDGWVLWHEVAPDGLKRAGDATLMARVRLSDASGFDLTDAGQWKALTIHIVRSPTDVPAVAKLGLDPLGDEFDTAAFAAILANRKKQIKALLQDQTAFAGIGNAYSDEILHAAKISPVTHAASLSSDSVDRLATATRAVLSEATAARRDVPPSELRATKHTALRVHRKTGAACPVCGDQIREYTFSGAAAQYCPTCQTGGALLA